MNANSWYQFLGKGLRLVVGVYGGLLLLLILGQSRLMYFPSRQIINTPQDTGLDYENLRLTTSDGVSISAWWMPVANPQAPVILFAHGNGGNISYRLPYIRIFHQMGFASLFFDYRGYGESEGQPSEQGTYLDGEASWNYLTQNRKITPQRIIIYGESLGGGIATYLAAKYQPAGLILGSTFTSIPDRAKELFPLMPIDLIAQFQYHNLGRLAQIQSPVLIIHSPQDEIIPFHHGQKLYEAANEPKFFLEIHGNHNEGFLDALPTYQAGIGQFIQGILAD
ncbi:hydrolase of the alpha/beta superfamily [Gloeomargarita lithophora Alchichica-D10]|uniref:Hydrolase of the alpha/beta superfamily n=1 Tax=Gloeomargarita lithophora Alchichica-D10 TaxID=1188229 RepID=A0A1J0AGZ8_9CYAN|nr:alpha/beta hydrolase [Gloeomargarita lithophora]APB35214.1 hydrolase of the alpha/beta superfamily [Gloeomargarita lithophora Alchichica-D10]